MESFFRYLCCIVLLCSGLAFNLGLFLLCVCVCVCVSLGAGVLADPAFNSCRDPGTPAYGIPIMAQGFQVGNNSRPHVFNGKAAK